MAVKSHWTASAEDLSSNRAFPLVAVDQTGTPLAAFERVRVERRALHPAGAQKRQRIEPDRDPVLGLQPVLDHLELENAHRPQDRIAFEALAIEEELDRALLR